MLPSPGAVEPKERRRTPRVCEKGARRAHLRRSSRRLALTKRQRNDIAMGNVADVCPLRRRNRPGGLAALLWR
ncbi:hypothetical protein C5688_09805 [Methylocystis sp. MitZ-2018]|nr:hypothetical protein C5688_09805 [Methylocystis sp. MitZ-2018]